MNLTNRQRLSKLLCGLIRHPNLILPYLKSNLSLRRRSPLSQNLPWWSFSAIYKADKLFQGKKIFEWGSGGSTLRYAKLGAYITAIEDDLNWLIAVRGELDKAHVSEQVEIRYLPFDFDKTVSS